MCVLAHAGLIHKYIVSFLLLCFVDTGFTSSLFEVPQTPLLYYNHNIITLTQTALVHLMVTKYRNDRKSLLLFYVKCSMHELICYFETMYSQLSCSDCSVLSSLLENFSTKKANKLM